MARPRIYTDEQRKERDRLKAKQTYYRKKGYVEGQRPAKELKHKHPSYSMWSSAKKRAKELNIPFDLELVDLPIPKLCPLLGIPITKGIGWYTDNSPTVDRLIPSLGYTKQNTWVISMRANRLKQDASIQELEMILYGLKDKLIHLKFSSEKSQGKTL